MESNNRVQCIDSCVILRLILQDAPELCEKARDLLLNGCDYYVDDIAIMEVVYVLSKCKWRREELIDSVLALLNNRFLIWDRELFEEVFRVYLSHPSLSFDDIVMAKRVERMGYGCLWTFDRKFANQMEVAKLVEPAS